MLRLQKRLQKRPVTINKKVQAVKDIKQAEEKAMNEQKLILDQPETVTTKGVVEHVVVEPVSVAPPKKVVETKKIQGTEDVLLNEDPMAGIEIILRD